MRSRVLELVRLVVTLLQADKDTKVVLAGGDLDSGAGELGRDLVETSCLQSLLGAADIKSADRGVMRGLLCKV